MPGRHGGRRYSTTAGSRHTRRLAVGNERAGQRSRRQRRWQSDTQTLELMTTQCCCQRRWSYRMLATAGRWMVAGATPAEHRPQSVSYTRSSSRVSISERVKQREYPCRGVGCWCWCWFWGCAPIHTGGGDISPTGQA